MIMATSGGSEPSNCPKLETLLRSFLLKRMQEPSGGGSESEVEPYSGLVASPSALRAARICAVAAADMLLPSDAAAAFRSDEFEFPREWTGMVHKQITVAAVPFALANYPQLVQDVTPLFPENSLAEAVRSQPGYETGDLASSGEAHVAAGRLAEALFTAAALRQARQIEDADRLLHAVQEKAPAAWADLLANEEAALVFRSGIFPHAQRLWQENPKQDSPVIQFNLGLVALCLDRPEKAAEHLRRAIELLPDSNPWQALAQIYLTRAELG